MSYQEVTLPASKAKPGDLMLVEGTTYVVTSNRRKLYRFWLAREIRGVAIHDLNDHLTSIEYGKRPIEVKRWS